MPRPGPCALKPRFCESHPFRGRADVGRRR
jgi:hypothetical protein